VRAVLMARFPPRLRRTPWTQTHHPRRTLGAGKTGMVPVITHDWLDEGRSLTLVPVAWTRLPFTVAHRAHIRLPTRNSLPGRVDEGPHRTRPLSTRIQVGKPSTRCTGAGSSRATFVMLVEPPHHLVTLGRGGPRLASQHQGVC
jgi:hypothetical protein